MKRSHLFALVLVAAAIAAAAAQSAAAAVVTPKAPTARESWAGRVLMPTPVRNAPSERASVRMTITPQAPISGATTFLGITQVRKDRAGRVWVQVDLPVRPNTSRGWIPADQLEMQRITTRIAVNLNSRTMTVYRSGRVAMRLPVAVGKPSTPSPRGSFHVAEFIRTNDGAGMLGPVVLALTGYSEKLNEFAGGDGRVAIHGTNQPQVIGTRASNGCIRMRNNDIIKIAGIIRPGTPVRIS